MTALPHDTELEENQPGFAKTVHASGTALHLDLSLEPSGELTGAAAEEDRHASQTASLSLSLEPTGDIARWAREDDCTAPLPAALNLSLEPTGEDACDGGRTGVLRAANAAYREDLAA